MTNTRDDDQECALSSRASITFFQECLCFLLSQIEEGEEEEDDEPKTKTITGWHVQNS